MSRRLAGRCGPRWMRFWPSLGPVRRPALANDKPANFVFVLRQGGSGPFEAWQSMGWAQHRVGDWRASIEALEKSCKLQGGGTGDAGQWIVLALAHAQLAAQVGLTKKEREHHAMESRRRYDEADKEIDRWWRVRPGDKTDQRIWDSRAEAR